MCSQLFRLFPRIKVFFLFSILVKNFFVFADMNILAAFPYSKVSENKPKNI